MNDNHAYAAHPYFSQRVMKDSRRRHLMHVAGCGPLLILMASDFDNFPTLDDLMLRDWPALVDGE